MRETMRFRFGKLGYGKRCSDGVHWCFYDGDLKKLEDHFWITFDEMLAIVWAKAGLK
jgi:hypothetical protein